MVLQILPAGAVNTSGDSEQSQYLGAPIHVQSPDPDRRLSAEQGKGGQLDLQTALPRVLSTAQGTGALWRPRFVSCPTFSLQVRRGKHIKT